MKKVSKKISVGIFGEKGRMGKEVAAVLEKDKKVRLVDLQEAKVVIDFSSPKGLSKIASLCLKEKIPLVSGTTGLTEAQIKSLKKVAKKIPVFFAPNMSIGLNLMAHTMGQYAKKFSAGEVEMTEIHHRHKKDNPSGTAKFLHQTVKSQTGAGVKIKKPIGLRGGSVFGIHSVYFLGDGEFVTFEHQATDRTVFARGAVEAAKWLVGKSPGFYEMKDLLDI